MTTAPVLLLLQVNQLVGLIELINGDLSKLDRKKLITLCTIDVHARDVVQRLIDERVESATCFQWQSQMRYVVSEKTKLCQVRKWQQMPVVRCRSSTPERGQASLPRWSSSVPVGQ